MNESFPGEEEVRDKSSHIGKQLEQFNLMLLRWGTGLQNRFEIRHELIGGR